jgi:hypothetical protein
MGWLKDLWVKVSGQPVEDLILTKELAIPGVDFEGQPIVPDECYLELYVESLQLEKARRFATNFHGVVYAFQQMAREGNTEADLAALSKPDKLAQLDQDSIGHVITVSRRLTGPFPWRGGRLHLELGLFSVKSGNVLSPLLEFVTAVSTTAGASFIGSVTPFVPLVTKGLDLLAGQGKDVAMEVGLDVDLHPKASATYAIINRPKSNIDLQRLSVDADRKLLLDGKPLEAAYCVFSIRQTQEKADYGEIPELKEKYAALMTAIKANVREVAQDALTAFRLAAITSPDLIGKDADRLVAKATEKFDRAFSGVKLRMVASQHSEQLYDLDLYDHAR